MQYLLIWWATAELLGLLAFPLTFALFKNLPDRGYGFSKAVALLLLSYTLWLLGLLHLLPNTRGSIGILALLLALASLAALLLLRASLSDFVKRQWGVILATELVFLLIYGFWTAIRFYDPNIDSTEHPMDFAFLNALLRSEYFPPHDPWLSGSTLSYYYYGYLMMAVLTKLSAVPSNIAYNLASSAVAGLAASGVFSIGYNLIASRKGTGRSPTRSGIFFGCVGVLLVLMMGNLVGVVELVKARGWGTTEFWQWISIKGLEGPAQSASWVPREHWWWWHATRVIDTVQDGRSLDYTITEFPFFSFLLGDLHPHVMSLPFVLLSLGMSLNVFRETTAHTLQWLKEHLLAALFFSLGIGSLGFLNSWDLPTFGLVFALSMVVGGYLKRNGIAILRGVVPTILIILAGSVFLYLPFYQGFQSQVSGILPQLQVSTRPLHYAFFWGVILFLSVSLLASLTLDAWRTSSRRRLAWTWAFVLPLLFWALWAVASLGAGLARGNLFLSTLEIWNRFWRLTPLMGIIAIAFWALAQHFVSQRGSDPPGNEADSYHEGRQGTDHTHTFVLLLLLAGFLVTLGPEFFFLKDLFGSRMNTMFKFYYQGWMLLGLASSYGLYYLLTRRGKGSAASYLRWTVTVLLIVGSLYYPATAVFNKTGGFRSAPTLDGLAFVHTSQPEEYEALGWLNQHIQGSPTILEAVGEAPGYGEYTEYARVSARTGLPTVLGWGGHELQWRGSAKPFEGRTEDVATIYQTADVEETKRLLDKYNIQLVYLGPLERRRYGSQNLDKFAQFMDVLHENSEVTIYRRRS